MIENLKIFLILIIFNFLKIVLQSIWLCVEVEANIKIKGPII
jgi:hypothetical protein